MRQNDESKRQDRGGGGWRGKDNTKEDLYCMIKSLGKGKESGKKKGKERQGF